MRNIGGNVRDVRLGEQDKGGGGVHAGCLSDWLAGWQPVSEYVHMYSAYLLLPVYQHICFDISVSYRAVKPRQWKQKRRAVKVLRNTAFLRWTEGKQLGCKSQCLHLCLPCSFSLLYFHEGPGGGWGDSR